MHHHFCASTEIGVLSASGDVAADKVARDGEVLDSGYVEGDVELVAGYEDKVKMPQRPQQKRQHHGTGYDLTLRFLHSPVHKLFYGRILARVFDRVFDMVPYLEKTQLVYRFFFGHFLVDFVLLEILLALTWLTVGAQAEVRSSEVERVIVYQIA